MTTNLYNDRPFELTRYPGNDYATDLQISRRYYGEMLDAYTAAGAPDDDYFLKLSAVVGEIEKLWNAYLAMLDAKRSPDRITL